MRLFPHPLKRLDWRAMTMLVLASVAITATGPVAAAHEGAAIITVEADEPNGEMSVDYVVRAVWDDDGHPVADATATVVAESGTGDRVGPVPMEPLDDEGRYGASVDFPAVGDWTVRFTVVNPPGTLEIAQIVPESDGAASGTTSSVAPASTEPTTSTPLPPTTAVGQATTGTDGERPSSPAGAAVFFFITAAIIFGACIVAYRSRGKRKREAS